MRMLTCLVALLAGCPTDYSQAPDLSESGDFSASPRPDLSMPATHSDAGIATIQPGATDRILLLGTIVSPSMTFEGEVLVEGGLITCSAPGTTCESRAGAVGATIIDTAGIITPGLIDTHNHILFDVFDNDDWLPLKAYMDHTEWPNEAKYKAMLDVKQCLANDSQGRPTWCPTKYQGTGSLRCEMDKFGELKGIVAGTTSIVGLPGTSAQCFSSLAHSIDVAQNGLGTDTVQTSALFPPAKTSADNVCANYTSGTTKAYVIHVGEGIDAKALNEFTTLGTVTTTQHCLYAPQTAITHGTAFGATEFATMGGAGMKLVWSPASNVALYGATANIPAALDAAVTIALAPDWSMGGSINLLAEMRFADAWDNAHFGDRLDGKALVEMTTANAAAVVGYADRIGKVQEGYVADLMVVAGDRSAPWDSIVAARPRDVRLTMVSGHVLYGDAGLVAAGPAAPGCEQLDVCGVPKFLCVAESSNLNKLDQTYQQIHDALEAAMTEADSLNGGVYQFAPLAPLFSCN